LNNYVSSKKQNYKNTNSLEGNGALKFSLQKLNIFSLYLADDY